MPVSRKRKKRGQPVKSSDPHKIVFRQIEIGGDNHAEFKAAMMDAARKGVDEFPKLLGRISDLFQSTYPPNLLSTFAFYGCQGSIDDQGHQKPMAGGILQYHVELLQALALMVPREKWGGAPSTGEKMQAVFDTVPEISDTFLRIRIVRQADETDAQKKAVLSLQEKIRLHTQAVRNWGYYLEVIKICRELYCPLDGKFNEVLGFSATDFIDVAEALVSEFERRARLHFETMRKFLRGKTIPQIVNLYFEHMPNIQGSPGDFIKSIPPGTSLQGVKGFLMSHADLRHVDLMTFTPNELATLTNKPVSTVEKVLDAIALEPGALVGANVEYLFLSNPVWTRPAIKLMDGYFIPLPQAVFSHINNIMRGLAESAKLDNALSDRRAAYLENKTEEVLKAVLPTARIEKNKKWSVDGVQYETDIFGVVDRTLIIVEAKSHRVSSQALRGAPDRLRKHLVDLVVDPSVQSERLQSLVVNARAGDTVSKAIIAPLGLDAGQIDNIIRLSVTLDDFSIMSSSEDELKEVGWIPEGHELAATILIADLICIAEILVNELQFLHYLAERFHFQKAFELLGDELDFLGLYLANGFNLGQAQKQLKRIALSGLSEVIDRYYQGREVGLELPRPKSNLNRTFRDIVDRLTLRKPPGWTTIGIHLLNSVDGEEQKKVTAGLERLRKSVLNKRTIPGDDCIMQIIPPLERKATIAFFVYSPDGGLDVRKSMEQIAADMLERDEAKVCVVFGKSTAAWDEPYRSALIVQKRD
ncbi:hypothetical protein [Aminobacter ciceronei]|uniref:NERD domain-containing protein n=1 Tax=Aminobacter ciceronei TaxID=150723 RepID=A0ABR6C2C3_9HYPH|nr:hypothetical protein [Aminobacter ciceronei]MBA8905572.1 hypothetical protein [Aminobacter ciceronei]MBA9019129.1 hypothetical protein [Aminobacter ciceronei]